MDEDKKEKIQQKTLEHLIETDKLSKKIFF